MWKINGLIRMQVSIKQNLCICQTEWHLRNTDMPHMDGDGGAVGDFFWRGWWCCGGNLGWRKISLISFATHFCINMTLPNEISFVKRWFCSVLSRKMPTTEKIINLSKSIFFIPNNNLYIPTFHAHSISISAIKR